MTDSSIASAGEGEAAPLNDAAANSTHPVEGSSGKGRHVGQGDARDVAEVKASLPWGGVAPVPLGSGPALEAVGQVAAPLLAGFSITLIGMIAQNPAAFRWSGVSLLILTVAVVFLLFAVEAGFHARQLYWTRQEILAWYKGPLTESSEIHFGKMHKVDLERWNKWLVWTMSSYNLGIIALLLGLAATLAPPAMSAADLNTASATSGLIAAVNPSFRWASAALGAAVAIAEIIWWITQNHYQKKDQKS